MNKLNKIYQLILEDEEAPPDDLVSVPVNPWSTIPNGNANSPSLQNRGYGTSNPNFFPKDIPGFNPRDATAPVARNWGQLKPLPSSNGKYRYYYIDPVYGDKWGLEYNPATNTWKVVYLKWGSGQPEQTNPAQYGIMNNGVLHGDIKEWITIQGNPHFFDSRTGRYVRWYPGNLGLQNPPSNLPKYDYDPLLYDKYNTKRSEQWFQQHGLPWQDEYYRDAPTHPNPYEGAPREGKPDKYPNYSVYY